MGVLMQGFYWDCAASEGRLENWWPFVEAKVDQLADAGITAIWLPPAHKCDYRHSMGYDPYDYFDLGEFDQRGGVATAFGTRTQLESLIRKCHSRKIQVYADVVYNHCSGGSLERNADFGTEWYTRFDPASQKFPRDFRSFHPSIWESLDGYDRFGGFPDLCHRNPEVYRWILEHARFLIEDVGFDGLRFDMVKGFGNWIVTAILERRYFPKDGRRNAQSEGKDYFRPFGVGEDWSDESHVLQWLDSSNNFSDNPVCAFDFPLRDRLRALCEQFGYSLRDLVAGGTASKDRPSQAVTFVDNHDFRGNDTPSPIVTDKMLGYAFALTTLGYPCVFWKDYYNSGLALAGEPSGIDALVKAHESNARGPLEVRWLSDDLYIMERLGNGDGPGLIFVLNNRGDSWQGDWIQTTRAGTRWQPIAWRGSQSLDAPLAQWTGGDARGQFWAPPRGYTVYAPQ